MYCFRAEVYNHCILVCFRSKMSVEYLRIQYLLNFDNYTLFGILIPILCILVRKYYILVLFYYHCIYIGVWKCLSMNCCSNIGMLFHLIVHWYMYIFVLHYMSIDCFCNFFEFHIQHFRFLRVVRIWKMECIYQRRTWQYLR